MAVYGLVPYCTSFCDLNKGTNPQKSPPTVGYFNPNEFKVHPSGKVALEIHTVYGCVRCYIYQPTFMLVADL